RRLVGQQHARPGRERSRDRHPPLLAAGEAIGATVAEAAEPHPFEPALRSGTRLVARDSSDGQPELDVFPGREETRERRGPRDVADRPPAAAGGIVGPERVDALAPDPPLP